MEDGQNVNSMGMQGTPLINTDAESQNDLMTRRLKNRERQRRYRARKRLETNIQKFCVLKKSTIQQVSLQQNEILNNGMKRVHCKRDWKKDARRAKICGGDDTPNAITVTAESQVLLPPSGIWGEGMLERELHSENSHSLGNCETTKTKLGRRDWKADARKKKS